MDKKLITQAKKFNYLKFLYDASNKVVSGVYPHQVFIETFSGCNYKCEFCATSRLNLTKGRKIEKNLFYKIINEIYDKVQFIQYYLQAEPVLNKELSELVEICNKFHVDDCIATNVSPLVKSVSRKLLENNLDQILFSITGASKEVYEELHPGGNFERVLKNMIGFLEMEDELGKIIRTRTLFVKEPKAMSTLDRYLKMFSLLPIDFVSTSELITGFFYDGTKDESIPKSKEEWLKVPTCTVPWRMMGINVNGDVRACFIDNQNRNIVGNVKEESVWEVWNGKKMKEFRQAVINRDFSITDKCGVLCSQCNAMVRPDALTKGNCWPYNFENEVNKFFKNNSDYFGYKTDVDKLKPKFEFLRKHSQRWLEQMVNPTMDDDEFIDKFK